MSFDDNDYLLRSDAMLESYFMRLEVKVKATIVSYRESILNSILAIVDNNFRPERDFTRRGDCDAFLRDFAISSNSFRVRSAACFARAISGDDCG